jgi:addiction module HigA family antidote
MEPLGMTAYQLAKGLKMSETAVGEILKGKRAVTATTALKLSRFLGCSARFWMGLQADHDLRQARRKLGDTLDQIARHPDLPQTDFEERIPVVGQEAPHGARTLEPEPVER